MGRRLGKRERTQVKNARPSMFAHVTGAGYVHVHAGRKKFWGACRPLINFSLDDGEPIQTLNKPASTKRPVYKVGA